MPKAPTAAELLRALETQRRDARVQAEQWLDTAAALEDALDQYVAMFAEAPIGYVTLDDRGAMIQMNAEAAAVLHAEASRATGRPFLGFVHPEDAKRFLLHLLQCNRKGAATSELRLAQDGRAVRLVTRRAKAPKGRKALLYTIVSDVTEERRQQLALAESEARYREIVETASEGICIVNKDGEIVFANRRLGAMVGQPPEILVGRSWLELMPAEDAAAAARAFAHEDMGPGGQSVQRLRRRDGTLLSTAVSTTIRRDERGEFAGVLRMYTDATARQELSEAREMLVRQLVAAQERERQRIARELHDQMGQHIVALSLGLARLSDHVTGDSATGLVEHLRGVAEALGRDMHTLAFELRPSSLDHLGLTAALRAHGEDVARRTALQLDMHCDNVDDLCLDPAVQTGIYRIAQEALTNVVKHADARSVSVILERRGDALQLIVEDDGAGFIVNDRPRAPESKLGLAGMRERAALLGGTLTIESSQGRGTAVYARFPITAVTKDDNDQKAQTASG